MTQNSAVVGEVEASSSTLAKNPKEVNNNLRKTRFSAVVADSVPLKSVLPEWCTRRGTGVHFINAAIRAGKNLDWDGGLVTRAHLGSGNSIRLEHRGTFVAEVTLSAIRTTPVRSTAN